MSLCSPVHTTPAFNTTFFEFGHLLDLRVESFYGCEDKKEAVHTEQDVVQSLKFDHEWRAWPRDEEDVARSKRVFYGSMPVKLSSGPSESSMVPYTSPQADAIYLTTPAHPDAKPSKVNMDWRTAFPDAELGVAEYDVWGRLSGHDYQYRGSEMDLVSEIWARKGCEEWLRAREGKHDKPVSDFGGEQKVFG